MGIAAAGVLFFGILYANNDIGRTAGSNGIEVIEIDSSKPFAVILPRNAGSIRFYDVNGNIVEAIRQSL